MVPHDLAGAALAAIRNNPVIQLHAFADATVSFRAMQKLKEHGIRATIRPFSAQHLHVVYVRKVDEEPAREPLWQH